ncbi:MAG: hypothetical protein QQN63_08190 [Nitrosopumilus sp.]
MNELIKRLSQKVKAYDDGAMDETALNQSISFVVAALKPDEVVELVKLLLFNQHEPYV